MLPSLRSPRGDKNETLTKAVFRDELKSFADQDLRPLLSEVVRTCWKELLDNRSSALLGSQPAVVHKQDGEESYPSSGGLHSKVSTRLSSRFSNDPAESYNFIASANILDSGVSWGVTRTSLYSYGGGLSVSSLADYPPDMTKAESDAHEWMTRHVRCNKNRATGLTVLNQIAEKRRHSEIRRQSEIPKKKLSVKSNNSMGTSLGSPTSTTNNKVRIHDNMTASESSIASDSSPLGNNKSSLKAHEDLKNEERISANKEYGRSPHPVVVASDFEPSPRKPTVSIVTRIAREEESSVGEAAGETSSLLLGGAEYSDENGSHTSSQEYDTDWPVLHKTCKSWRAAGEALMNSWQFDCVVGMLIMVNALAIGLEADYRAAYAQQDSGELPPALEISEVGFAIVFGAELCLRLWVQRCAFFIAAGWAWNVFDFAIISLQIVDQLLHMFTMVTINGPMNVSFLRLLRIMRLIRITRLIRVLRLIEELRTIVASIMGSLRSLVWTLVLLVIMIYTASVCFTQVVLDAGNTPHRSELLLWFGRLGRTVLTMFECISGGVSWDVVVVPLATDISPCYGVLFCLYVAFCVLAMMNVVTGVFVQKAIQGGQEDKDNYLANHISELFFRDKEGCNVSDQITWEEFESRLGVPDMQDYFKEMNVDVSEARGLFRLLDVNNSGTVDVEEVINGCLRLRGPAKALEMHLLLHETTRMRHRMITQHKFMEVQLHQLKTMISKLAGVEIPEARV